MQEIDMSLLPVPTPAHAPRPGPRPDSVGRAPRTPAAASPDSGPGEAGPRLLAQLPTLQALGVFDLFTRRDPALRALVRDELQAQRVRAA